MDPSFKTRVGRLCSKTLSQQTETKLSVVVRAFNSRSCSRGRKIASFETSLVSGSCLNKKQSGIRDKLA